MQETLLIVPSKPLKLRKHPTDHSLLEISKPDHPLVRYTLQHVLRVSSKTYINTSSSFVSPLPLLRLRRRLQTLDLSRYASFRLSNSDHGSILNLHMLRFNSEFFCFLISEWWFFFFSQESLLERSVRSENAERGRQDDGSLHPQEVFGDEQAHHCQGSRLRSDQHWTCRREWGLHWPAHHRRPLWLHPCSGILDLAFRDD